MLTLIAALAALGSPAASPPVSIWMNNDRRFREGDQVKLQVDAEVDGYLLVLNYDTDGRLRILFPLDPRDDALVHAGRRYEVRDERGSAAFRAGGDGSGLIYSAIAPEPWRFDDITLNGRWDDTRIALGDQAEDPEAKITEFVQQLSGAAGFDYDVAGYRVYGAIAQEDNYVRPLPYYGYPDYLYCYDWYWSYDGCRFGPYYTGWSIGFGYYPYRYYSPYQYGYPYYYPYYPYRPGGSGGRRPVVIGRPRTGGVISHSTLGTGRFGAGAVGRTPSRSVALPPVNWRPRSVARPSAREPGSSRTGGRVIAPPARRARVGPSGFERPSARAVEGRREAPPQARPSPRASGSSGRQGGGGSERGGSHAAPPPRSSGGGGSHGGSHPPPSRPRRP